ncbi:hypothetical protein QFZ72_003080 [Bacillus sp. V2I10]|nr:hypothetical protein [Bacillus sp. V2I10]
MLFIIGNPDFQRYPFFAVIIKNDTMCGYLMEVRICTNVVVAMVQAVVVIVGVDVTTVKEVDVALVVTGQKMWLLWWIRCSTNVKLTNCIKTKTLS